VKEGRKGSSSLDEENGGRTWRIRGERNGKKKVEFDFKIKKEDERMRSFTVWVRIELSIATDVREKW
jgi:predicted secreted protein